MNAEELQKLREAAGRDNLAFLLLRRTRLRGGDAVNFIWDDVRFDQGENGEIEVRTQKRRKKMIIPLIPELRTALENGRKQARPADFVLAYSRSASHASLPLSTVSRLHFQGRPESMARGEGDRSGSQESRDNHSKTKGMMGMTAAPAVEGARDNAQLMEERKSLDSFPSSGILFGAVRRDIDEYVCNDWQRETDFVVEVIHRSREFLDIQVCRWMNLSRDDDLLGSRVNCT
jgi:hypothetical protein